MRKIKKPKIEEYVLVTKYSDKDPYDPWYISFISEIIQTKKGFYYKVQGSFRIWNNVFRITKQEGKEWCDLYRKNT